MSDRFQRTEMLLGPEAMHRLGKARVAVFGVGGVGGYVVEALARSGVGALDLIDKDVVDETNINRQLLALTSTIGRPKVEVAAERVKDISPDCVVTAYQTFFLPDTKCRCHPIKPACKEQAYQAVECQDCQPYDGVIVPLEFSCIKCIQVLWFCANCCKIYYVYCRFA